MFPPKPANNGINIAIIGKVCNVWSKWLPTLTAINSPIKVINNHGVLALIELKILPVRISSSSTTSVEIPDDW